MAKRSNIIDPADDQPNLEAADQELPQAHEETAGRGSTPYEVGYKKPPREHQFKKGQSGNPSGRKKGKKTPFEQFREELMKPVALKENGEVVMLSFGAFLARAAKAAAVKKDVAAIKYLVDWLQQTSAQEEQQEQSAFDPDATDTILKDFLARALRESIDE